ncbi:MAG: ABC transporter permease, partial [Eubacterium sp.]|nr:ABC transporter permease [Eubacterium sp.]
IGFATPLATLKFAFFTAMFGLGQMIIISAGGYIDLSVGYTATLVTCLTCSIIDGKDGNMFLAILIAIAVGVVVGLINGFFSVYAKLPSLVVTMAVQQILQGIVDFYSSKNSLSGQPNPMLQVSIARQTAGIPNNLFILIIVAAVVLFLMYKSKIGVKLTSCGANATTAHLSGITVNRVRMLAFIACSVIAALMGLVLFGNMGQAFKDMGSSYVMPSIAAVVIGGLSINGGDKNYIGVILGAVILQALENLFVALGMGDSGKYLGSGIILMIMLIVYVREKNSR